MSLAFVLPFAASWFATGGRKKLNRRSACRVTNHARSCYPNSLEKLLAQLSDVSPRAGPGQLQSGFVQTESTIDRRK